MKSYLKKYIGREDLKLIFSVILLGSLCHFLYDWSGHLALAALFCPVNESVWEHLKLLYFPFLLVSLLFHRHKIRQSRFLYSRFLGVCCGIGSILVLFYTYTGITGQSFLPADLLIFCFSTIVSFFASSFFYHKLQSTPSLTTSVLLWTVLSFFFFFFTCYPPNLPLFFPPNIV